MAEVVISVASKLSEYLVDPAFCEGRYLFCVAKITRNLETKKEELILTQGRVQKGVEEALKRTEEIDDAVKRWKNKVKEIIAEVENLQQELKENNGCFRGWCPTWKRYRLCKQLAKKTETILELNRDSKFDPFSYPAPLPDIEYFSSGNFMYFKSTEVAEGKLLDALRDDSCYMIGLYGMGGSGKTSLAKEAGKKAKELKIFDHVVFTTISQKADVRKIQDEIADILGLEFKENTDSGRAIRLSMRLKSGKQILIILDDVWKKLDFEKIGIPVEGENKGCKVLLTTREQQVCRSMNCKTRIPLDLLSEDESWSLFKKYACINDASFSNSMNKVARGVVRECKGLPIAIVAVGTSLKEKPDSDWRVALDNLKHAKPLDLPEGERDAFTCLKISYDFLKNEAAKSILLMCSMFPEDHEIEIEDLSRYGIGLGLREQHHSFEIARDKVNVAIRILIESCLLTYSGENNVRLKMHDMVRDAALWIASREKGTILINQDKKLDELGEDKAVQDYCAISSWDMEIDRFPCQLNAPKLEILLLNPSKELDLSDASFEGVKELKVIAVISNMYWRQALSVSLPQTTQWLTNLRTLRLVRLNLEDISFVVCLRRLEILDLQYSEFKELPNGIEKLNKLKLLDLSKCRIEVCCDDVIGRCSQLEELYVYGSYSSIESYKCFEENVNFIKLWGYIINVGKFQYLDVHSEDLPKRVIGVAEFNIPTSSKVMKDLLQRAAMVCLRGLKGGCKSVIPEMVQAVGGMKQLTDLNLKMCDEIEYLINIAPTHAHSFQVDYVFPMLVKLSLQRMSNLKDLCRSPRENNLCNLKYLRIVECPKLKSLFPMSVAQTLLQLEEISLGECEFLEHIIRNGEGGTNTGQEILTVPDCSSSLNRIQNLFPLLKELDLNNLPYFLKICQENYYPSWPSTKKQEWELETDVENDRPLSDDAPALQLSILGLQHLQSLRFSKCGKVKYLFSMDVLHISLPCLNSIDIKNCEELEEIIYENEESKHISNAEGCFPNLKELVLERCNKLKRLFSSTIATMLPQLESLTIMDAPQLVEVFRHKTEDNIEKIVLPNLREIELWNLPVLVDVCQGMKLHAVKLDDIKISKCPKFTPDSVSFQMAPEGYDEQVSNQVLDFQKQDMFVISAARQLYLENLTDLVFLWKGPTLISFKSLESLRVNGWIKLKSIFSAAVIRSLPQLQYLTVWDCEELEEIISEEEDKERQFLNLTNSHPQHVPCFPKLFILKVSGCGKLKCVFPMSMARYLPELYEMEIEGCSKLEHVFGSEHKAHDTEVTELVLPKLKCLKLIGLPSLIDIGAGFQPQFRFQALDTCKVKDCPNFLKPETVMVPSV